MSAEEEAGKHAVKKQAKKLVVRKVKTVKSARRSDRHGEKSEKKTESKQKRGDDGARPKLVRDEGNMLNEDNDNIEPMEVPEEVGQCPGKDRIPLVIERFTALRYL